MDEYEFDSDQESEEVETPEPTGATDPTKDPRYEKLQKENRSLRGRLRRTEAETKWGKEIAELIPDAIPLKDWDAFAEKLQALKGPATVVTEQTVETPEVAQEPPTAAEQRLATVGKGTGQGEPVGKMTYQEWAALRKTDRARADSIPLDQLDLPDNPLPPHLSRQGG